MKKFFLYFIPALALVFAGSFAKANEAGNFVNLLNSGVVNITLNNNVENHAISITDENGRSLYEYNDVKAGAFKNFDFSNVPDGEYFIKVEDKKTIETTQLEMDNGRLTISDKPTIVVKPVFKRNGDKLNVYFLNPNNGDIQVDIYNQYNVLVNSTASKTSLFEKTFDFSKSLHGSYKVVLAQDDNVFTTNFDY